MMELDTEPNEKKKPSKTKHFAFPQHRRALAAAAAAAIANQ
jgi:hypothetical protein